MPKIKCALDVLTQSEMEALFLFTHGKGMALAEIARKTKATEVDIQNRLWGVAEKVGGKSLEDLKVRTYDLGWLRKPGV